MLSDTALSEIPVTDMNWASLTSWREILSQILILPKKLSILRNCKQITIRYNNKVSELYQYTERRAVYLQGWLAAQLQWQYIHFLLKTAPLKSLIKIIKVKGIS